MGPFGIAAGGQTNTNYQSKPQSAFYGDCFFVPELLEQLYCKESF
jgi:hypothetical protein